MLIFFPNIFGKLTEHCTVVHRSKWIHIKNQNQYQCLNNPHWPLEHASAKWINNQFIRNRDESQLLHNQTERYLVQFYLKLIHHFCCFGFHCDRLPDLIYSFHIQYVCISDQCNTFYVQVIHTFAPIFAFIRCCGFYFFNQYHFWLFAHHSLNLLLFRSFYFIYSRQNMCHRR